MLTVYQGSKWRVVETQVSGWGAEYTVEWLSGSVWIPGLTFDGRDEAVNFAKKREGC